MKKTGILGLGVLLIGILIGGCGTQEVTKWKVTCPWAETGVAAMVNEKTAQLAGEVSKQLLLEAEAVKGDAATVNQWVEENDASSNALVFAGEGLFAIAPIMKPENLNFSYEDFVFDETLPYEDVLFHVKIGDGHIIFSFHPCF